MSVATFQLGPLATNSHLFSVGQEAVCIDVGGAPEPILAHLKAQKLTLTAILLTHLHFDHLYGVAALAEATKAPAYAPEGDACLAGTEACQGGIWGFPLVPPYESRPLPSGKAAFGGISCEILPTPGHTPGGVSFYFPSAKAVFTGDALFYRSMGRTDFPLGDQATLLKAIREVLFALPDDIVAYPGHGPATTIGEERRENPFCGDLF